MSPDSFRSPVSRKSIVSVAFLSLLTNVSLLLIIYWLYRDSVEKYLPLNQGDLLWWAVFSSPPLILMALLPFLASMLVALLFAVLSISLAFSKDRDWFGSLMAIAIITMVLDILAMMVSQGIDIFALFITSLQHLVTSSGNPALEANDSLAYSLGFWYLPLGLFISFCCNTFLLVRWESIREESRQAETLDTAAGA